MAAEPVLFPAFFARVAALASDVSIVAKEQKALAGSIGLVEVVVVGLGLGPVLVALTASGFQRFGPRCTYQHVY